MGQHRVHAPRRRSPSASRAGRRRRSRAPSASRRSSPCSRAISSSIPSIAIAAASSRSSSKPNVSQASGVHATGHSSGRSSRTESVSCARSTGASIASCETSPSPWRRGRRPPRAARRRRGSAGRASSRRRAPCSRCSRRTARRRRRVHARLVRRHPDHAEERPQRDLPAVLVAADAARPRRASSRSVAVSPSRRRAAR